MSGNDETSSIGPTAPGLAPDSGGSSANDKALRVSETRYRRLFESARDGILILNAETAQIDDVNPFMLELLGYSRGELLGKTLWEIGAFKDTNLNKKAFVELQTRRYIRYDNLPLVTKHGQRVSVEFVSNVYDCAGTDVIQCNIRDNTKRHIAEVALKITMRSLKMLSDGNRALLNASDETTLRTEYCRIAVETGGYRMAWIGVADNGPDKRIIPVAHYGLDDGFLDLVHFSWAEKDTGYGPAGRAIRSGQMQFTEDIATDAAMAPWRAEALKRGFQSAIVVPMQLSDGAMGCLSLYLGTRNQWSDSERELLDEVGADLAFGIQTFRTSMARAKAEHDLRVSLEKMVEVVASTIEERDSYTGGHQRRVASISARIAAELGLSSDRIHGLRLAASIHDLGKIGVPAEILVKPKRLSANEFDLVKQHPDAAYNILKDVDFPWPIADIVLQHHERVDGSGYPRGLTGDAILLESKILAVADVIEAMASHRPYRPALGIDAALEEISAHRGMTYDCDVVDACLSLFRDQGYRIDD